MTPLTDSLSSVTCTDPFTHLLSQHPPTLQNRLTRKQTAVCEPPRAEHLRENPQCRWWFPAEASGGCKALAAINAAALWPAHLAAACSVNENQKMLAVWKDLRLGPHASWAAKSAVALTSIVSRAKRELCHIYHI